MEDSADPIVYIAEHEPMVALHVRESLVCHGMECCEFTDGRSCVQAIRSQLCDVLVADTHLPDMHALTLIEEVLRICPCLPVIVMTAPMDVNTAVLVMRAGAFEAAEKNYNASEIFGCVRSALGLFPDRISRTMVPLTRAEHRVLGHVLEGKCSHEIAHSMNRSPRTIEAHRGRILKKFGVRNTAELCRRLSVLRSSQ